MEKNIPFTNLEISSKSVEKFGRNLENPPNWELRLYGGYTNYMSSVVKICPIRYSIQNKND